MRNTLSQSGKFQFPEDINYRALLAKALDVAPDNLEAIMGAGELKYLLKNGLQPEHFCAGKDFENIYNAVFRINLHIHTLYSDGSFSPAALLEQAVEYGEYRRIKGMVDPVIVSVTDHDTLAGTMEALKLIAGTPEKYRNIRFVPGIELNSFICGGNQAKKQFEVLAYCINPFEICTFIREIRQINLDYIKKLIAHTPINFEYLQKCAKYVRAGGSPALMSEVLGVLREKAGYNTDKIVIEHIKNYGALSINPGTPSINRITQNIKGSGFGFVSVAHPGRMIEGFEPDRLFEELKEMGVEAVEANYHYIKEDNVDESQQESINTAVERLNMLKTGGIDSHRASLFSGREPEEVSLPVL